MTKKTWVALLMALALAAGCLTGLAQQAAPEATDAAEAAPAETTAEAPAEEAEPAFDLNAAADDAVLLTVGDDAITKADVITLYDQMMQQYAAYGMDFTNADNQQALLTHVLSIKLQETLLLQKAAELKLDQFTEEELAALNENAQAAYDQTLEGYKSYFVAEGKTDDEVRAEVAKYLEENSYSMEMLIENAKKTQAITKVVEYATQGVEVAEEDVKAAYDQKVEAAKASYAQTPGQFTTDISGGAPVYYTPEGCRTVKHILVKFDKAAELQSLQAQLGELKEDDPARAQKQAEIDELMKDIQPKLDEIKQKIDAGEDFQALIDAYGEDGGMKTGTTAETGYYMNADTTTYMPEFTEGGMALEKVGDVSEPVLTSYGFHIIRYNSDVPSGETPYEQVKDALTKTLHDEAIKEAFSKVMDEWAAAVKIENHLVQ